MLEILGLDELEEQVYRALLESPALSVSEIAKRLHRQQQAVRTTLSTLADKGFVQTSGVEPATFRPIAPERAADPLLRERIRQIDEARREVVELADRFASAFLPREASDIVEVIHGRRETNEMWVHVTQSAREELLNFDTLSADEQAEKQPLGEQVWDETVASRLLFDQSTLAVPGYIEWFLENADRLTLLRVTQQLPFRMLVGDRRIAVVIEAGSAGGIVVHPSAVLNGLVALFDTWWSTAIPLVRDTRPSLEVAGNLTDEERHILSMLATGVTELAVARSMGISRSSIDRRMKVLTQKAGATSRFQLAYLAMSRGWISPSHSDHPDQRPAP